MVGVTALTIVITCIFVYWTPPARWQKPREGFEDRPARRSGGGDKDKGCGCDDVDSESESENAVDTPGTEDPHRDYATWWTSEKYSEGFSTLREGMDDPVGQKIKDAFEKPFKDMAEKTKSAFNKVGDDMKGAFDKVGDALMKPINDILNFVHKVDDFFKSIPGRVDNFNLAFRHVGDGIKMEFENLGASIKLGFDDVFDVITSVGTCGIDKVKNFSKCFLWYAMDALGHALYSIFVQFPVYLIKMASGGTVDAQKCVDMVIDMLEQMDEGLHKSTGAHFMHFPDAIQNTCYFCSFETEIAKLNNDWQHTIPDLLNAPRQKFSEAKHEFISVFS